MTSKFHLTFLLLLAITVVLSSCDRGYELDPVGTNGLMPLGHWAKEFDGFKLEADYMHGLAGEDFIQPSLTISTDNKAISIERVELVTARGTYIAEIPEHSKVIPPFSHSERILDAWMLNNNANGPNPAGAADVLGKSSQIVVYLKVDDQEVTVAINYQKVR